MKIAIAFLALPLLAQQPGLEKERALGQHIAAEISSQSKPVESPLPDLYVKRVGSQLAALLGGSPFEYSFEVVSMASTSFDAIEPIGLPGGYVLVPARLFSAVQDEDEFVGMLAHSIAHGALRQGMRIRERRPVVFIGSWRGTHISGKGHELEADRFGLELTAKAGYDATAFRRYIERVQTAPGRELRLASIDEALRSLPPVAPSSAAEFLKAQEVLRVAPPAPPTLRRRPSSASDRF